jgi:hypothetical protein
MEHQTRYDLNAALETWRRELAAQPGLTAEARRQLETRLHNAIAELRHQGLTEEESFWLACRRVGRPQKPDDGCFPGGPAGVWRERVFWMAVALLALNLWTASAGMFINIIMRDFLPSLSGSYFSGHFYFVIVVIWLPLMTLAWLLVKGRFSFNHPRLAALFRSRRGLAMTVIAWVLFNAFLEFFDLLDQHSINNGSSRFHEAITGFTFIYLERMIWPLLLIALLVSLLPASRQKDPQQA